MFLPIVPRSQDHNSFVCSKKEFQRAVTSSNIGALVLTAHFLKLARYWSHFFQTKTVVIFTEIPKKRFPLIF